MLRFSAIIVLFLSIVSCDDGNTNGRLLPGNTGNSGEIIVVAPAAIWKSDLGQSLHHALLTAMPGLPAEEAIFSLVEINTEGFRDLFKTHRNIIFIELYPARETEVKVSRDLYARQQFYVSINLKKQEDLQQVITRDVPSLLWHFHKAEIDRLVSRNQEFGDDDLNKKIEEKTGLKLYMQQDFVIAKEAEDFLWLRLDREKPIGGYQHQISQGIMIYSRPYNDTSDFSDTSLSRWKNEVNARYVDGPQGSHMTISYKLYPPEFSYITFHGNTAREIRGLWRMEGYFMGGPFYSLSFYNPANGRQYMAEGYVFGPQFDKLAFVREVEAIIKSISFPG